MKEQGNCTHAAAHKAAPAEGQPYSAVFSASGDSEPGVSSDFVLHIGLLRLVCGISFYQSISLRSRKECHGTGSRHIECRGDVPPEEDRPTKVANMDHIGCGGSLKITLALTAARQHGGGDVQPAQFQGPLYYPQY